jgi:hypothetical protein
MSNKNSIKLNFDTPINLIGLGNISLSCINDNLYISNTNVVSAGLETSLAVYKNNKGALGAAGEKLVWDDEFGVLYADNIVIKDSLKFSLEEDAYVTMPTLQITKEVSFQSAIKDVDVMFATIRVDEYVPGVEKLSILTRTGDTTACSVEIDQMQRVTVKKRLNIKQKRLIKSSKGSVEDLQGDIAANGDYLYYCHKDYDGVSNIWSRWRVTDNTW